MPPVQTTYTATFQPGYVGMVVNQETSNIVSRTVADAGGIGFGVPVFQGPTDLSITAVPNANFLGITVLDRTTPAFSAPNGVLTAASPNVVQLAGVAGVMTMGVVWTTAAVAVTARQPVYITAAGAFSDVASGDTAVPGATFDSSASANALVKIRIK